MSSGGSRPERHGRAVEVSQTVYLALTRAYPEDLRGRYGEEMVRCFGDLCRDELRRRGLKGLAAVWARTLPELVLTALKERSTMLARNAYLPVAPRIAARWGALSALLGGSLGMAFYLVVAAFPMSRWFERPGFSTLLVLTILNVVLLLSILGTIGLYGALAARSGRPGGLAGTGAALAAVSAVCVLAAGGYTGARELALGFASEPAGAAYSGWYSGWDFYLFEILSMAGHALWFSGLLLLGAGAFRARLFGSLRALPLAVAALLPASLLTSLVLSRFGYFPTLIGSLPFLGSALLGWALLKSHPTGRLAAIGGAAGGMPRTAGGGYTGGRRTSAEEAAKEKELLEALARRGALTVAGAALETSLTVEQAERMLSALAAKGHLEVRVEHGRLLYSLWERRAPP